MWAHPWDSAAAAASSARGRGGRAPSAAGRGNAAGRAAGHAAGRASGGSLAPPPAHAQAIAELRAALDGQPSALAASQAATLHPSQRPAVARQLQLLRLLRAATPSGEFVSEAQLKQALSPLRPRAPALTAAVLASMWRQASGGRVTLLLDLLCPLPTAADGSAAVEAVRPRTTGAESSRVESSRVESSRAEPSQVQSSQALSRRGTSILGERGQPSAATGTPRVADGPFAAGPGQPLEPLAELMAYMHTYTHACMYIQGSHWSH